MSEFANDNTTSNNLVQFDLAHEIEDARRNKPWPSGHVAKLLLKKPDFRMVLLSMEKGSVLKEHHADGPISVHVLKGSIRFSAEGNTHSLGANAIITLGASIKHAVEALEESAFLLTIAWPEAEKLESMKHRGYS